MIRYIKLQKHKAVKEVKLVDLGRVNVICGKNNSGKTSLAEAIATKGKSSVGRAITKEDISEIAGFFEPLAQSYSTPSPAYSMEWFNSVLAKRIGEVLYQDDIQYLNQEFKNSWHDSTKHGHNTFDFQEAFKRYLAADVSSFDPILIPPKRELSFQAAVSTLSNGPGSMGQEVLNRLFIISTKNNKTRERAMYEEIEKAFAEITDGCMFHIQLNDKKDIEIQFSNSQGEWIGADDSGLGFRDILVILRYVLDDPWTVIIIEEPENHIHPDMQRKLLKFISSIDDKQFFFTTHSSIFLDPAYVDKVIYVEIRDGQAVVSDETNKANLLSNLGYSIVDNIVSDLVVLTEGPYDIPVIKEICNKLGFLHKYNIKFYPLGGDIMTEVDLSIFLERNEVMAIVDSDPGSKTVRDEFEDICKTSNIRFHKLARYSIENYFSLRAIKQVYPNQTIPAGVTALKPDEKVSKQLGFSVKNRSREIVRAMTLGEFVGSDLLSFCEAIEAMLKSEVKA